MAPWTLDDLLRAKKRLYPHLTDADVEELYYECGGSPRLVLKFAKNKQQQQFFDKLVVPQRHTSPERLADMLRFRDDDSAEEDQFMQITPYSYTAYELTVTSEYAENMLEMQFRTVAASLSKRLANKRSERIKRHPSF
jgi:hypothetical protein